MAQHEVGRWEGGVVKRTRSGRVYWIKRMVDGVQYELSTRCATEEGALAQLRRWERCPVQTWDEHPKGFTPSESEAAEPLFLDAHLVDRFLLYIKTKRNKNGTVGNSHEWAKRQASALKFWIRELAGKNLRTLEAKTIKSITSERNKLTVLQSLYSWMQRSENLLTHSDNPMPNVKIPQAKVAQDVMSKVIRLEDWQTVRVWLLAHAHLAVASNRPVKGGRGNENKIPWDRTLTAVVMEVLLGCGWHLRETLRFAFHGELRPNPDGSGVIVTPKAKKGSSHACQVSQRTFAAAIRLQELVKRYEATQINSIENRIHQDLREAAEPKTADSGGCGVQIKIGWHRHTVATHALQAGNAASAIAAQLGNSERMVKRVYAALAVPPKIATLI